MVLFTVSCFVNKSVRGVVSSVDALLIEISGPSLLGYNLYFTKVFGEALPESRVETQTEEGKERLEENKAAGRDTREGA